MVTFYIFEKVTKNISWISSCTVRENLSWREFPRAEIHRQLVEFRENTNQGIWMLCTFPGRCCHRPK